mmetsp:Transcript_16777/g.26165  ORF Transcript_16777/g.26165 Transcript_16777/m.26165 type:complete len:91 (-) Transcript_16777:1021-1293(-)
MLVPPIAPVAASTLPVFSKKVAGSSEEMYSTKVRMILLSLRVRTRASSPSWALTPLNKRTMQACLAMYKLIGYAKNIVVNESDLLAMPDQ